MFHMILAVDENMGLGNNNTIPWNCKTDLLYFQNVTRGHILIVGRKTWESMPQKQILQTRHVIVVSRSMTSSDILIKSSFSDALILAYEMANNLQHIFAIGGGMLYEEAIQHIDLQYIYLTKIKGKYSCDTHAHFLTEFIHLYEVLYVHEDYECIFYVYSKII